MSLTGYIDGIVPRQFDIDGLEETSRVFTVSPTQISLTWNSPDSTIVSLTKQHNINLTAQNGDLLTVSDGVDDNTNSGFATVDFSDKICKRHFAKLVSDIDFNNWQGQSMILADGRKAVLAPCVLLR